MATIYFSIMKQDDKKDFSQLFSTMVLKIRGNIHKNIFGCGLRMGQIS